ncbi:hypothetical protein EV715DRAFT_268161 [Schizophyllum commune]
MFSQRLHEHAPTRPDEEAGHVGSSIEGTTTKHARRKQEKAVLNGPCRSNRWGTGSCHLGAFMTRSSCSEGLNGAYLFSPFNYRPPPQSELTSSRALAYDRPTEYRVRLFCSDPALLLCEGMQGCSIRRLGSQDDQHHSPLKRPRERAAEEAQPDADAALTRSAAEVPDVVRAALNRMVVEDALEAVEGGVGEGVNAGKMLEVAGATSGMTAEGEEATATGEGINMDGAGDDSIDEIQVVEDRIGAAMGSVGQDETLLHPATEHPSMPPGTVGPRSNAIEPN